MRFALPSTDIVPNVPPVAIWAIAISQSVNRHTPAHENTAIELAFEHILNNVSVVFRIKRSWTSKPKEGKDTLGVLVDDWPDTALAKTWDEYIENLLPLGISNLFLFDGEQVKELAELEAPPPIVVEAIQSLLGLELAQRLSTDLDILINRKRKALASATELANLEEIEQKLQRQQQEYEAAKQDLASQQNELERAQEKQQRASEKFISEGGKIAAERSQLEQNLREFGEAAQSERQKLQELAAGAIPLDLISPLLHQARTQGERELKRGQAKVARDVLQERDGRLLDYINQLSLQSEQVDQIKSFLEKENQVLEQEISGEKDFWLGVEAETINKLHSLQERDLPNQLQAAEQHLEKLKDLKEEVDATEKQLASAASPEVYAQLEDNLKHAQNLLKDCQAAYETARRKCEELGEAIARTKKELEHYGEQNLDRKNEQHIIDSSTKVQKTLQQFRERLTLKKLNKLEFEVTECFRYLLHKSDLVHRVAVDSQTYRLSLYDPEGQLVPKHRLSAGEKQLLAVAFLWGLARVSGRRLPVAIDTPLGRLDSSHRNNLVERYFPAASHQVILLSTDTEIGKTEVEQLRASEAIAQEYLLKYDSSNAKTEIQPGYFW